MFIFKRIEKEKNVKANDYRFFSFSVIMFMIKFLSGQNIGYLALLEFLEMIENREVSIISYKQEI